MSEDWDLFAVVRSCGCLATNTNAKSGDADNDDDDSHKPENPLSSMAGSGQEEPHASLLNRDDIDSYCYDELQDSCKPFFSSLSSSSSPSPSFVSAGNNALKQEQEQKAVLFPSSASIPPPVFAFQGQHEERQLQQQRQAMGRSRKRKNQQKRTICHVTQEHLSSDMWAWRKYGQKPIKGSPYPRNYYRCSSSKGCLARKQVERSNLNPNIFILTYTGEHTHPRPTHRNSLAGSTRNKSQPLNPTHKPKPDLDQTKPGSVNDANMEILSPTTPLKENDEAQGTHGDEDIISQEITIGDDDEIEDGDADDDDDDAEDMLIPNLAARDREDFFSNV